MITNTLRHASLISSEVSNFPKGRLQIWAEKFFACVAYIKSFVPPLTGRNLVVIGLAGTFILGGYYIYLSQQPQILPIPPVQLNVEELRQLKKFIERLEDLQPKENNEENGRDRCILLEEIVEWIVQLDVSIKTDWNVEINKQNSLQFGVLVRNWGDYWGKGLQFLCFDKNRFDYKWLDHALTILKILQIRHSK